MVLITIDNVQWTVKSLHQSDVRYMTTLNQTRAVNLEADLCYTLEYDIKPYSRRSIS